MAITTMNGRTLGMFAVAVLLTACGMDWNNIFGSDEGEPAPAEPSSVLFIGNSLTFWHEVPTLFWELSRASDREMEVHQITRGGASIQDHLEDEVTRDTIHDGTMAVADALDLIVAPVGSAWDRVLAERPGIELYDTDGLHPSVEASYLMASVYYAVIHRRRLTDIEYYGEISNTLAVYLRGVAAGIVLENASHWHLP